MVGGMSGLEPRTPRAVRERRAYTLVMVSGTAGVVFAVGALLAIFGVIGWGVPLIALIVAVVAGLLFRGMVSRR